MYFKAERADEVLARLRDPNGALFHSITGLSHFVGEPSHLVKFACATATLQLVIAELSELGVGKEYGTIDVLPLTMALPITRDDRLVKKRQGSSVSKRRSVEEIWEVVDNDSHLTFDFILGTFCAALIAAVGLAANAYPAVVASMLISPLMGPIMCVAFGWAVRDRHSECRISRTI